MRRRMRVATLGLTAFVVVIVLLVVGDSRATGRTISFAICAASSTWTRPTEEQQRAEVWSRSRYANADEARLRPILYQEFFQWGGGNSELFDEYPLHGLWSATDTHVVTHCDLGSQTGYAASQNVDIFLLNHKALSVKVDGSTYQVRAKATQTGFQHIEFKLSAVPDPDMSRPFKVQIMDPRGFVFASFADCTPSYKETPC